MDTKTLLEWSAKYHTPNYGARAPICLVRGDGTRVWDSDGREYLDFGCGIAVTSLGHCHPRVTGAIREAAATLLHVSNLYHTAPQIHLAKLLCEHSFAQRAYFCNSGAEANEAALKLVRKYAKERYASDRYEVIATRNAFHGRTFATVTRSEEHTSELQSLAYLVCRLLLEKKKKKKNQRSHMPTTNISTRWSP